MKLRLLLCAIGLSALGGCVTAPYYADDGYYDAPDDGYTGYDDGSYDDGGYYDDDRYDDGYYDAPYGGGVYFNFNFNLSFGGYGGVIPYGNCWCGDAYCDGRHPRYGWGYWPNPYYSYYGPSYGWPNYGAWPGFGWPYYGGYHPPRPPKPKPPKPPKPDYPIVDRDGPLRPGPGWQPRVRRAAAVVAPAAAMSAVPAAPVNTASVNKDSGPQPPTNVDQAALQPLDAMPRQNPRNQRLAREPQARAASQTVPARAVRPQSEARSRPEPMPRPARVERASKSDDNDP